MTFLFQGYALGFGATFSRPFNANIPSQASASLSISGGYGSAYASRSSFPPGIRFEEAFSEVYGGSGEIPGTFITVVKSTIRGLNILDKIYAESMTSTLTSIHSGDRDTEPEISTDGSEIVGLNIGGVAIEPRPLNGGLRRTYQGILDDFNNQESGFRQTANVAFNWARPATPPPDQKLCDFFAAHWDDRCARPPVFNGRIMCSIYQGLEANQTDDVCIYGNVVAVRNFGRIFVGELFVEKGLRRLNMLRFDLGSPDEGAGSGAGTQTNGSTYP